MGSPYRTCDVIISGGPPRTLPNEGQGYQDIKAWSPDRHHLALVQWSIRNDKPGFHVLVLSTIDDRLEISPRIEGCCHKLVWRDGQFEYTAISHKVGRIGL